MDWVIYLLCVRCVECEALPQLDITQKSAWLLVRRIREILESLWDGLMAFPVTQWI